MKYWQELASDILALILTVGTLGLLIYTYL